MQNVEHLIRAYYAAFNAKDEAGFLALLTEDVEHFINQGSVEKGKAAFAKFLQQMNGSYDETITDIVVLMEPSGARAAAEFVVHGTYLAGEPGLPPAHGQNYVLPAGAFFTIQSGKIARISNFYNLPDWIAQVGQAT